MFRLIMRVLICLTLICEIIISVPERVLAANRSNISSPVSVTIKLAKDIIEPGEPLEGQVILTNISPVVFPASFDIRIFHNDQLVSSSTMSLKRVPRGITKFSFKHFGIRPFTTEDPDAEGSWRVTIVQLGLDSSHAAAASVNVLPRR